MPQLKVYDPSDIDTLVSMLELRLAGKAASFLFANLANANLSPLGHDEPDINKVMFFIDEVPQHYGRLVDKSEVEEKDLPINPTVGLIMLELQANIVLTLSAFQRTMI